MNFLDTYFGYKVQKRRNELGLSLDALSVHTQIKQNILTEIEAGKKRASVEELYLLSRALEVSITYFYSGYLGGGKSDRDMILN